MTIPKVKGVAVVILLGALVLGAGAFVLIARPGIVSSTQPNLLLITVDTLRADRLGAYGWARAATAGIDGLAARGVVFENAFTVAPITLPAHATLLTGHLPPRHGQFGLDNGFELYDDEMPGTDGGLDRTREGVIAGTPSYMSPEQTRGQAIDKRTDIWAFGCVLYEILTARPAFPGEIQRKRRAGLCGTLERKHRNGTATDAPAAT